MYPFVNIYIHINIHICEIILMIRTPRTHLWNKWRTTTRQNIHQLWQANMPFCWELNGKHIVHSSFKCKILDWLSFVFFNDVALMCAQLIAVSYFLQEQHQYWPCTFSSFSLNWTLSMWSTCASQDFSPSHMLVLCSTIDRVGTRHLQVCWSTSSNWRN